MLHQRDMSIKRIAKIAKVSRTSLNLAVLGERTGRDIWKHVDHLFLPEERDVLRRTTKYSVWEEKEKTKRDAQVEQTAALIREAGAIPQDSQTEEAHAFEQGAESMEQGEEEHA